jgi:uncharacterized protein HemX
MAVGTFGKEVSMESKPKKITEKAQIQFPKGLVVAAFFVLVALLLIFGVIAVLQIRMVQFNKRMYMVEKRMHTVEDSVTRIEDGMEECVRAIRKYGWAHEEASDFSRKSDRGIEVGVGDRTRTR